MGGILGTLNPYSCKRSFNVDLKNLLRTINYYRYNNFCDEFDTSH